MTQRDTYTPEQVAEVAGVTRRTVYRWIVSERLPAHKIGPKMWVIYRTVLMAFMAGKDTGKLHNMAASLQGRRTVMTPPPVPGSVTAPNDTQPQPVSEGYMSAYDLSQQALAEIKKYAPVVDPARNSVKKRSQTVTFLQGVAITTPPVHRPRPAQNAAAPLPPEKPVVKMQPMQRKPRR